jgi:uncharacterized membrane protein
MFHSILLPLHIAGGMVGLLSGAAAMIFRKGSLLHILAGRVFVVAMLTMGTCATWLAILKHDPNNIGGGIMTFYLIMTAWLTARRKDGETSRFDWAALVIPLVLGILTWKNGIDAFRGGTGEKYGVPTGMHLFLGSVLLLAAAGDLRMLLNGGVSGAKRLGRHLWRMCFGLFIASGSFFFGGGNRPLRLLTSLGIARFLPSSFFTMGVYMILTILPLVLLIFWALRVRLSKRTSSIFGKQPAAG